MTQPKPLTKREKVLLALSLKEIEVILKSDLIKNVHNPAFSGVFTKMLIDFRDLIYKSGAIVSSFQEAADMIKFFRDAASQPESKNRVNDNGGYVVFSSTYGKGNNSFGLDCLYDDLGYVFGNKILYLENHLVFAFNEIYNHFSQDPAIKNLL